MSESPIIGPYRVSAKREPCSVHTHTSGEVPASTERHHVLPIELQKLIWPDTERDKQSTIRVKKRVPLCGSGHSDVHLAIDAQLDGKPVPAGVGPKERRLAREAVRLFNEHRSVNTDVARRLVLRIRGSESGLSD